MSKPIHHRDDVNPQEGERKYGDERSGRRFADPVNNKYPIDTAEHVRAAWSYINKKHNAEKYSEEEVARIRERIKKAARTHGVNIESDEE